MNNTRVTYKPGDVILGVVVDKSLQGGLRLICMCEQSFYMTYVSISRFVSWERRRASAAAVAGVPHEQPVLCCNSCLQEREEIKRKMAVANRSRPGRKITELSVIPQQPHIIVALDKLRNGASHSDVAGEFGVSPQTVLHWYLRWLVYPAYKESEKKTKDLEASNARLRQYIRDHCGVEVDL